MAQRRDRCARRHVRGWPAPPRVRRPLIRCPSSSSTRPTGPRWCSVALRVRGDDGEHAAVVHAVLDERAVAEQLAGSCRARRRPSRRCPARPVTRACDRMATPARPPAVRACRRRRGPGRARRSRAAVARADRPAPGRRLRHPTRRGRDRATASSHSCTRPARRPASAAPRPMRGQFLAVARAPARRVRRSRSTPGSRRGNFSPARAVCGARAVAGQFRQQRGGDRLHRCVGGPDRDRRSSAARCRARPRRARRPATRARRPASRSASAAAAVTPRRRSSAAARATARRSCSSTAPLASAA